MSVYSAWVTSMEAAYRTIMRQAEEIKRLRAERDAAREAVALHLENKWSAIELSLADAEATKLWMDLHGIKSLDALLAERDAALANVLKERQIVQWAAADREIAEKERDTARAERDAALAALEDGGEWRTKLVEALGKLLAAQEVNAQLEAKLAALDRAKETT